MGDKIWGFLFLRGFAFRFDIRLKETTCAWISLVGDEKHGNTSVDDALQW